MTSKIEAHENPYKAPQTNEPLQWWRLYWFGAFALLCVIAVALGLIRPGVLESKWVVFLAFAAVVGPIIYWLMWREDFDGIQSEWRYKRELKQRDRLSLDEFYEQFYKSSGVDRELVVRMVQVFADAYLVDAQYIRPHDNYSGITAGTMDEDFIAKVRSELHIALDSEDAPVLDGSVDSIIRYLDSRLRIAA